MTPYLLGVIAGNAKSVMYEVNETVSRFNAVQ